MLMTVPAAQLMQRRGRKLGFALGAALGVVGGTVGCLAVYQGNFALLCLGGLGIGAVNGFATYYRFAAGEVVAEDFRSRAISLVMAGGVVAAVSGSNLAAWSREWFPTIYSLALFWGLPPFMRWFCWCFALSPFPRPVPRSNGRVGVRSGRSPGSRISRWRWLGRWLLGG